MTTVADIVAVFDRAYPPRLAEPWDTVGLAVGDPDATVTTVALAVDCTDAVVADAIAAGADMLITHHPLLLKGATSVAANTPKGRAVHRLIGSGIALLSAHTNADSARPGVNDALARALRLRPGRAVAPRSLDGIDKWGVMVPAEYAEAVKQAVFDAGAGAIGNYDHCVFTVSGTGQFRPTDGANPTVGEIGELTQAQELRIEFVARSCARVAVTAALNRAHPYEVVAYDVTPLLEREPDDAGVGLGRVCTLDEPLRFSDFVQHVADHLPATTWGVRGAGDPDTLIRTVAVCSGAGDSFLDDVARLGVDAYVTSDLRHHPVDEYLRAGGPCVVDTAHWASEFPWCAQAADLIADELPSVRPVVLSTRTDPWTVAARPGHGGPA